ncbi:MAG TPA: DUF962 domain-containing protein [Leptospiraceae bacterium]|nr:DUF962 domain-containing protein [Leptospiraceae bacterium]HMZ59476.1 DUF962 domain-containing protein [Leptospiraceae bacterium]HNF13154.1 DUF962 domain-containing protein [Leptospiraceae bacterium]HNF24384.1 DUF962 domain-containing protein [Leptospiraceae bacterium]HNI97204.1 DUF962 domain-containing protein [Leptospiraceae bacterium]
MKEYRTLAEFWPFYLSEHSNIWNRRLHFIGSTCALLSIFSVFYFQSALFLLLAPVSGYGFAWFGHFIIEKNRPATFKYPVKSFVSDWIMYFYTWTGKLDSELQKAGVELKK